MILDNKQSTYKIKRMKTSTSAVYTTLLTLLLMCHACTKSTQQKAAAIANGTYKGTFQRTGPNPGPLAQVTIAFNNGNWSGNSQTLDYPALCEGTYQFNSTANTASFYNYCAWYANIDFTLILSQQFQLTINGNTLKMEKDQGGGIKDVYLLTKQ
jgi:hypothetical protein